MFKLSGIVKVVSPTVQVSEKFSKREFVVTDETNMYPQDTSFQSTQDKCTLLDAFKLGDVVQVSFNLRGREWNGPQGIKYFNTLEAWRIETVTPAPPVDHHARPAVETTQPPVVNNSSITDNDDLPF